MATIDPYQVLGVGKTASQDEIKNAYRKLAKQHHPDLNPGNKKSESQFKDLSLAYEMVGNPDARAKYDRGEFEPAQGGAGFHGAGAQAGGGYGGFYGQTQEGRDGGRYSRFYGEGMDEDIFESIFGGGGGGGARAKQPRKPRDEHYQMEIDLRDSVAGGEKEITLPGGKRLKVKIPAGVTSGTRLRFAGQAAASPETGQGGGDVYVELRVREDSRFRREGVDLIYELPVSLNEAVFGSEVKTPTIDGEVMLKIPRHANSGMKLKLAGQGVFDRTGGKRGNQIVIIKVMLPKNVDAELEAALKAWGERHHYNPREKGVA